MIIIGAGMAGLLAGAILRHECSEIWEKQLSLPNNHSSLLRFRSSIVGDALNIPFKKVQVVKAVLPHRNPVADAIAYSMKTNGSYSTSRSIVGVREEVVSRYIAPPDLISQMASRVTAAIEYGCEPAADGGDEQPFISTMPMPDLMELLDYPQRKSISFKSRPGINITLDVPGMDAYATLYVPNSNSPVSRISAIGSRIIVECYSSLGDLRGKNYINVAQWAGEIIGISDIDASKAQISSQPYAKIQPIDEDARRRFILWASETHRVYSLGRFATWRPGLLLDDLVQDVRIIHRLIRGGSSYEHRRRA